VSWLHRGGDDDALADAQRPRGCPDCGRTFLGSSAFTVHKDPAAGCLPDGAYGQLENRGGVWARPGDPAAG
jgi:hypothetical protein